MFPALKHFDVAHHFLMGYMDYYYRFKLITKRARIRFEQRDWHGTQADARSRIHLYRDIVSNTTKRVVEIIGESPTDPAFWSRVKYAYAEDIAHFDTRNIAETFYNSVYRHFHQVGANPELMFVSRTGSYREFQGRTKITHDFGISNEVHIHVVRRLLDRFVFDVPWENKKRDASLVASKWTDFIVAHYGTPGPEDRLEILTSVFYRNKSAYIVGRYLRDQGGIHPFILPLLHPPGRGILVDALLLESDQVTSIFSYHRSYFLADITVPSDMVDFLATFMPTKAISELYNAIGFEKHGKTVFYRELRRHFRKTARPQVQCNGTLGYAGVPGSSDLSPSPSPQERGATDARGASNAPLMPPLFSGEGPGERTRAQRAASPPLSLGPPQAAAQRKEPGEGSQTPPEEFITAPGIAGMVMYVFTMPTLNMVFKIIRDKFAPPKQVTHAVVKEKYDLVKRHDRVGRMADSYLFEKLSLPRDRFAPECLEELLETAPTKVEVTEDCVMISHVYVEKKMTPLNIYLETSAADLARKALRDYGRAIKQLAAANIFPGDLLLKNFGVTRVGRVVFYDYDEIELVTDCNFRHIPEARTYEQEMASQPWYYVGPKDIFPEEFPGFLMRAGANLNYLREKHGDIFDADFWNDVKSRLLAGEIMDVFPYRTKHRFLQ